jgi:hypothetical protein
MRANTTLTRVLVGCLAAATLWGCPENPPDPLCGPESCFNGCCRNGECIQGTSNAACGAVGTACAVCTFAQVCTAGDCIEAATWEVRPLSASITFLDPRDQLAWDVDSSPPDVVVSMGCPLLDGGTVWSESEEVESYAPTFNTAGCRSSRQALIASGVVVDVVDRDLFFDDPIEALRVPLDPTDFPIVGRVNAEQFDGGLISITISVGDPQ